MNSILSEEMMSYLSLREKTLAPSSLFKERHTLSLFDQYLTQTGRKEKFVSESDVAGWTKELYEKFAHSTVFRTIALLRNFLRYLQMMGIPVFIPPLPKNPDTYVPYHFSDSELEKLFHAADASPILSDTEYPYCRMELPMLLRMLYACGFRLGEILAAHVGDVDFGNGVILLKDTKNKKQRIVPMTNALNLMLRQYCLAMGLMGDTDNYIFPHNTKPGRHLHPATAYRWFRELLEQTGIYIPREEHHRGQCLHCLRHMFAVRSFAQMEKSGHSIHDSVPFLSVYLGHTNMNATERYLKFSSEIFPEHTALFEAYTEGIFPEVRYEE